MKYLILLVLLFFSSFCQAFPQTISTTVTSILINNSDYHDIEVLMTSDNKIYLPVKQTAKIFSLQLNINHSQKEVTFSNFECENITVNKNGIFINEQKLNNSFKFQKDGIIEVNEFYIDKETADKIFNSEFTVDPGSLCVQVKNNYIIKAESDDAKENTTDEKNILHPQKKGKLSFDTFEINNSMMNDSTKQVYLNATQNNVMFNNNTRMSLKGKLYDGDYSLNFNTNNYTQQFFSFGGLSFSYRNKLRNKYYYELGQVSGFRDNYNSIGTMLIGAQISDYNEYEKQNNLTSANSLLKKGESKHRIFAGISGFNNRLFSSNGYIYQMNSKKFVAGGSRQYGLNNDMTLDTKIIYDKLIQKNNDAIFLTNLYNDYSILSSGVYRNPNTMEGISFINTLNLYKNEFYKLNAHAGVSVMRDFNYDSANYNPGYSLSLENIFDYHNSTFKLRLYQQSPNYYVAGSDSGFICDRLGAEAVYKYSRENFNTNLRYTRYFSNLDNRYSGGITTFDEAYINAGANLFNFAKLRLNGNLRYGENNVGHNLNYYYNLNTSKNISSKLSMEAGLMGNAYNTEYNKSQEYYSNGFKSTYNTIYLNTNYRLPKNKGALTLGHDTVSYETGGAKNNYNMIKVNYRFPEFKRIILALGIGYKYQGLDGGCTYSAAIGYRTKTGMIVSLNYQYNTAMGYVFNNMYIPANSRHSINFTFNDTFAFSGNGLQSIGTSSPDEGFVEIGAYIDKNHNGVFDKEDIKISGVPISVAWKNQAIKTKRNGFCPLQSVEKGFYEIKLDSDNLHANLSPETDLKKFIYVEPMKTTRVEFPLKSTVGNISGKLNIKDEFDRKMIITDFIVSLYDLEGNEIAYSTVDQFGNYYFSGIAPGKYKISLDHNFINDYNLIPDIEKGEITIDIPYIYKEFVELKNQDLVYMCY